VTTPRIVGVAQGPPFDALTFSGGSRSLFTAIRDRGALTGAVSGGLPRPVDLAIKAASYSPERLRWHQRTRLNPARRALMSAAGNLRARRVDGRPDALLQIGAFYDLYRLPGLRPGVRCSFHDGNQAVSLRRGIGQLDRGSGFVRRSLRFERRVYDGLDLIMPISEWLRASFIEDFGQSPDRVVAVGAGANLDAIPDPVTRGDGPARFLFVGKDFPRKGGETLLAAFAGVRAEHPDAELWIVGPPSDPAPGRPGVVFHGQIDRRDPTGDARLLSLYRTATAFAMPSIYEPFGFVFLEAMAWSLPCLGTTACAMPEIIDDGRTGFVVPPSDADALGDRMSRLAADPAAAAGMGRAGRERFLERYTWDVVAGRVIQEIQARLP
jgi:glycosyltransferase involved in cell wall biosynthesis